MMTLILISSSCIIFIYYPYYKLLFDQINNQLKSLTNNGSNVISKSKEIEMIRLIHEHNRTAIGIHSFNLIVTRITATLFICLSLAKIFLLYMVMNMSDKFLTIILEVAFVFFLIFGFGSSIIFSLQIKSAHQSEKLIYLMLCRYKMRLSFRLKVNKMRLSFRLKVNKMRLSLSFRLKVNKMRLSLSFRLKVNKMNLAVGKLSAMSPTHT